MYYKLLFRIKDIWSSGLIVATVVFLSFHISLMLLDVNIINLEVIFGVLINYTERKFFGLRKTQHWCCIRNLHNSFVLFNSFQDQPEIFENETDVFLYFTTILSEKSGQILLVVEPDLEGYVYK
eukprot:TRINITY_DN567_c0_g1_i1.p1 TRINITY_DN567_c0_g1~~TRINITY_DN567_c0_g1_i1.p1  ORF type:complete len:124 (-),score=6.13 TRINITY_DN567_c0_g1_i1:29-400(-)